MGALPLDGITVLSLEQAVAGPFATRQLADLGARVIKIERDSGDFARGYDQSVHGMSSYFVWLNRGKESVVVDLKSVHGAMFLEAVLPKVDILVHNLAPGAADRLGLDAPSLSTRYPRLISASISGYGRGGPYEQKKAYDLLVQCEAGLVSVTVAPLRNAVGPSTRRSLPMALLPAPTEPFSSVCRTSANGPRCALRCCAATTWPPTRGLRATPFASPTAVSWTPQFAAHSKPSR